MTIQFDNLHRRRGGKLLVLLASALVAGCDGIAGHANTSPFGAAAPGSITLSFNRSAGAAIRLVTLAALYRMPASNAVVLLAQQSISVAGGNTEVPFSIDLARCLNDAVGPTVGGACPIYIAVVVRDEGGVLVDSVQIGPYSVRPGQVIAPPELVLGTPSTLAVNRTVPLGLSLGDPYPFSATARDATGRSIPPFGTRWTSSAPSVLSIDSVSGVAVAQGIGVAQVRVARNDLLDSAEVVVLAVAANQPCRGAFDLIPAFVSRDTALGGAGKILRPRVSNSRVQTGARLRIAAGTVICFGAGNQLQVSDGATIQAEGNAAQRIQLVSEDVTRPWNGVIIGGQSNDSSRFLFVEIRNAVVAINKFGQSRHALRAEDVRIGPTGGASLMLWSPDQLPSGGDVLRRIEVEGAFETAPPQTSGAVRVGYRTIVENLTIRNSRASGLNVVGGSDSSMVPTLRNIVIENSSMYGLIGTSSTPLRPIENLQISGSGLYPIYLPATAAGLIPKDSVALSKISGNARDTIVVNGTLLVGDTVTAAGGLPWLVESSLTVPSGAQLRVGAGGTLVFSASTILSLAGGSLDVRGSSSAPARLTARDSVAGWTGIAASGSGTWAIDQALIEQTRGTPAIGTGPSGVVPRMTRTVMRRFRTPAVFSQVPGAVIEDSRFEDPLAGSGFGILQPVVGEGTRFELRRSVIFGAGVGASGLVLQNSGTPTTFTVVIDSSTIDMVGGKGLSLGTFTAANVTLRGLNLTRIGGQAINWTSTGAVLQATGFWFGSPSAPPAASTFNDLTPGSIWNPAFVNYVPVSTSPIPFPEPPRASPLTASIRRVP